jgi:hypothetical protein
MEEEILSNNHRVSLTTPFPSHTPSLEAGAIAFNENKWHVLPLTTHKQYDDEAS